MKKIGAVIRYECATSFKYIWIFYACVFLVVSAITLIAYFSMGNFDDVGTSALEVNSLFFVGVLGVLGFQEDFKMLIQNGFTRKYIFLSTVSLFAFVSAIMSLVDTVIGNVLPTLFSSYSSLFNGLYGYEHSIFINWLWLFLAYMFISCLFYLIILGINVVGKSGSIIIGIILGLVIGVVIPAAFRFVLPEKFVDKAIEFAIKCIGFMADGTINFMYPVLLLLMTVGILSICSYFVIRRTELKA